MLAAVDPCAHWLAERLLNWVPTAARDVSSVQVDCAQAEVLTMATIAIAIGETS